MTTIQEIIQDYKENKIPLSELQETIWGLSESSLEMISEESIHYYINLIEPRI
ncbi:hypothetical protein AB6876_00770 [Carnobacterium maltaromaticum]|jgi:hypothetical protein|uniref:Uncharacterized protein n=1 Tax=Carnobacterium maltaromaticum TaxID=2751 RepID=A0A1Z5AYU5_CARML|nr:hypothetical protein [Carnobacterium maltaromaticum]CRI06613.1 protein of unknown function [Carnobacterium maltaromaticum]